MFLISDLCSILEKYLDPDQVREIYKAYLFGAEAHQGQRRMSGEAYIYHPIAVARILAEMRLDHKSIIAAILHDVIEDTPIAREELVVRFGEEVASLVDGVSKLTNLHTISKAEAQAESFRKMFLAMVQDIRVILIKLADRLHNMRTLTVMRPDKRRRIAVETLEIYAPIALRLGIYRIRLELEDLGFSAYYPLRYRVLKEKVAQLSGNNHQSLKKIRKNIKQRLETEGIDAKIQGREKHLYSLYQKMKQKHLSFSEVSDIFGFRIVVKNVDSCYRVMGIVHNLYKPIPGKFKDYIAIPKSNGYQSLHTTVLTRHGFPVELQIRTREMHQVANAGVASHWIYKGGNKKAGTNIAESRAREWLHSLLEMQQKTGDSIEFMQLVKVDLFPDEVYIFTPRGEIMELPRGATALDFAYAVHSQVGNRCFRIRIDQRYASMQTRLSSGQTVEVITRESVRPNPSWLNFVTTAKARTNIRSYLKNLQQSESMRLGLRLLENALHEHRLNLNTLPKGAIERELAKLHLVDAPELFTEIGLGNRMAPLIARSLAQAGDELAHSEDENFESESPHLSIQGTEGSVITYAKCCRPIPGDSIFGFLSSGRGMVIHTQNCKNVSGFQKQPQKWVDVVWEEHTEGEFLVDLRVAVTNERGVLATLASEIARMGCNIANISLDDPDGLNTTINLTLNVTSRHHLAQVMRRIRNFDAVLRIYRARK